METYNHLSPRGRTINKIERDTTKERRDAARAVSQRKNVHKACSLSTLTLVFADFTIAIIVAKILHYGLRHRHGGGAP